jgi:chemotaxis protein MotB
MARKKKHEDHINHEAWAIPYGDLITLLLAFFVVMYAISSVNEGKFRVLSDSLTAAFNGAPRSLEPVQIGDKSHGTAVDAQKAPLPPSASIGTQHTALVELQKPSPPMPAAENPMTQQLKRVADELEGSLQSLVEAKLVTVRRHEFWLEVEVRTDILFPSGVATLSDKAIPALDALAATLVKYPNPVRVEGHTDDRPIASKIYPSNWELSAARAASVVHRFANAGVDASRLSVIGFGEFRPAHPNDTAAGRDANRRVVVVILSGEGAPMPGDAAEMANAANAANAPVALPPLAAQGDSQRDAQVAHPGADGVAVPANQNRSTPSPGAAGTETAPLPVTLNAGAGNPAQE